MTLLPRLGLGIGWRPELALLIDRRTDLGFVEITAENERASADNPALRRLLGRGVHVVPHGISVSLGSASGPRMESIKHLAALAIRYGSPLVSEHIAFVHAGDHEAGHLMPLERTREQLDVLVANVRLAQSMLPVPLALENISALVDWPGAEMTPEQFLGELVERTGVHLLLDVANVYANAVNIGTKADGFLRGIPLDRLAYVHVGGGFMEGGIYHDSHAHSVAERVFELLGDLGRMTTLPGAMLERDDDFPTDEEVNGELNRIAAVLGPGP